MGPIGSGRSAGSDRSDGPDGSGRSAGSDRSDGPDGSGRSAGSDCPVNICTTRKMP